LCCELEWRADHISVKTVDMIFFCVRERWGVSKSRLRVKGFLSVMRKSECVEELRETDSRLDNDPYVDDQMSSHHDCFLMKESLYTFCVIGALEFFILVLALSAGSLVSLHAKRG
jgi:hypothetical protein